MQIRPSYTLAYCWDVKQPTNKQTNKHVFSESYQIIHRMQEVQQIWKRILSSVRDAKLLLLCFQLLSSWKRICQQFRKLVERFKCLCVKATCQAMNTLNFCFFSTRDRRTLFLFKHLPYDQADYVVDIIAMPVSMLCSCLLLQQSYLCHSCLPESQPSATVIPVLQLSPCYVTSNPESLLTLS